ncbi:MAG: glycosyltransferase [Bacteroidota bacterium]
MPAKSIQEICIISPSLKVGGIQRELVVLANYYVNQGLKVHFITCFYVQQFYSLDERVNLIEHHYKHSKGNAIQKIYFYLWLLRYLRQQVKAIQPEVVLTYGDITGPLVLCALYGLKYPVFIGDKTSPDYVYPWPIPTMKKWFYPTSAGFVAQTSRAANYRDKEFSGRLNIKVIPNGIREVKLDAVDREPIVLYVGRFAWEKAPNRLIEAFAKIPENEWTLHMAGDGPMLAEMKALVAQKGLAEQVVFHGQVREIDKLFSRASIFVMPSVLEGFPNALCEAMWAGLPCVCFDALPYEDIFENGKSGIAVKEGDIDGRAATILSLMEDPGERKRLGDNALTIRDRFTTENAANTLTNFMLESIS